MADASKYMNLDGLTPGQRASVECIDSPLLISAGAGSGKTFTLTQRIAYVLATPDSGVDDIDGILAITFTDKAAAEIKARVRSTLRAIGMTDQALRADGAWISTIHGMCSRILHTHAFELGLDPTFRVLDAVQETQLLDEAIDRVLVASNHERRNRYAALFLEYGANEASDNSTGSMVKRLISEAAAQPAGLDAITWQATPPKPSQLAREMTCAYEVVAQKGTKKQQEVAEEALRALNSFLLDGTGNWDLFADMIATLPRPGASGAAKDAAIESQRQLDRAFSEANLARSLPLTEDLVAFAREVVGEYERLKLAQNVVDTDGLLRNVLQAFDDHPELAQRYHDQFKLIMVDEFQDTNQLQIDLIGRIAGPRSANLCTIGDSQQSIYGFRGADVGVYRAHKHDMRSDRIGARYIELDDNFRSHADVLAFVRAVCGKAGYFPEQFLDLKASRDESRLVERGKHYRATTPRIDVMLTNQGKGTNEADARRVAAQGIAARFAELAKAGHKASDMVLLLGASTHADIYSEALRNYGFDCIVAGGSGFFASLEVKLIERLLAVIACPGDTEALFAVLSSELLMLSPDDLIELSTGIPNGDGLPRRRSIAEALRFSQNFPDHDRIAFVAGVLNRAWDAVGKKQPSHIVKDILIESGWLARIETQGVAGQTVAGNVFKALRFIEDIECEQAFDMVQTARKFALLSSGKENPGALMVGGSNAVRIMTVHSSKGLEFPFVAVAECYSATEKNSKLLLHTAGGGIHISLNPVHSFLKSPVDSKYAYKPEQGVETSGDTPAIARSVMLARRKQLALEEKRRLFYVAATRASEALIISMINFKCGKRPIIDDIEAGLFGDAGFPEESVDVDYGGSEPLRFTRFNAESEAEFAQDDSLHDGGRLLITPALDLREEPEFALPKRERSLFSYSAIADATASSASGVSAVSRNEDRPIPADADKATDFGSAFHRLAQIAAGTSFDHVFKQFDALVRTYSLKDPSRLNAALDRWRRSNVCRRAFAYSHHVPEVPFCVPLGDVFLEGEIDLLCFNEEGHSCLIVDYKTGGSPDEEPANLHAKHLLQAQCYAYATLSSGFADVELIFARVEQGDPTGSDTLDSVSYRFVGDDIDDLRAIIEEKQRKKAEQP